MTTVDDARTKPLRVVIADDDEDIRLLLNFQFTKDGRFEVVGEAPDGSRVVELAGRERPDLVILDQQMPARSGVEAIADIKRRSPETAVILYTADADLGVSQAAFDAGALEVLEKVAVGAGFVDQLVSILTNHDETMEIRVGPVSSAAAGLWIANTRRVLDAAVAHPEIVGHEIPDDVVGLFRSFLDQWETIIATTDEFRWVARAHPEDVERIVRHWGRIDAMKDEQLAALGVSWAPPESEPFFEALTSGTLHALSRHERTKRLAERLGEQWGNYLTR